MAQVRVQQEEQLEILWKARFPSRGVDAREAMEELMRLNDLHDGASAVQIVEAARDRDNVLHPIFPWNDRRAAHERRLQVAMNLVGAITVRVVIEGAPAALARPVRVFVRVDTDEEGRPSVYKPTHRVLANVIEGDEVLQEALDGLNTWRRKYGHMVAVAELVREVDGILEEYGL